MTDRQAGGRMGGVEGGSALHCAGSASELTFAGERICVGERRRSCESRVEAKKGW